MNYMNKTYWTHLNSTRQPILSSSPGGGSLKRMVRQLVD